MSVEVAPSKLAAETTEKKRPADSDEDSSSDAPEPPTFEQMVAEIAGKTRKRKVPAVFTYEENHTNAAKQAETKLRKQEARKLIKEAAAAAAESEEKAPQEESSEKSESTEEEPAAEESKSPKKSPKKRKGMLQKVADAIAGFTAGARGDSDAAEVKNESPAKAVAKKKKQNKD